MTQSLRCLGLGGVLLFGATACASRDVLGRASPDGQVEAVVVAASGGTPAPFSFEIHLVPFGRPPQGAATRVARLVDAARTGGQTGPFLRWTSPTELHVEYLTAATAELSRPAVALAGREVRVSLDSGVAHAPPPPDAPRVGLTRPLDQAFLAGHRAVAP
jgi:hypothetical protein